MSVVQTQLEPLTPVLLFLLHPEGSFLYPTHVRLRQCSTVEQIQMDKMLELS